jgi:hypothetical protein
MKLLDKGTAVELMDERNIGTVKLLVSEMSTGLTIQKALEAPKIFQVKKTLGMENLIKLFCVIIKSFCDSIKAKNTMDAADILECAELIAETYTHDSVKDIVMALKQAKKRGHSFYNSISIPVIFEIITEYMDQKAKFIEKVRADEKSAFDGSVRTEAFTIATSAEKAQEAREKSLTEKALKQIQNEKKEIKKIEEFIKSNVKNIE